MTDAPAAITSTLPGGPDATGIAPSEGPARDLNQPTTARGAGFQVVIQQHVLDAMHAHGQSNTKVEVCGVMVGRMYHDAAGPYLLIDACIAGDAAHSHAANVTFTSATWTKIHEEMDKLYPDERIVGWYHTHPAFGIFLSEMDIFIQANFFNLPWQVAFVYDPIGGDEGMFVWRNGVPTREPTLAEPAPPRAVVQAIAPVGSQGPSTFDRFFAATLLVFVAILLVLLIIYEIRSAVSPTPGPVGLLQRSANAPWMTNR